MMKKYLVILSAAGAMTMGAMTITPFAGAQEGPPNGQTNDQPGPPPQENSGGPRHGAPDPARRAAELSRQLNLNSDQQAKVLSALQSASSQMQSVRQDSSTSPQDRHAKMMDIHRQTDAQIRSVLNPDQQRKFDRMMARREQRMEHRGERSSPDGGQQAPPQ